jgi:branched-chain amino acid aminotransferase
VWLNDRLVPADQARVSVADRGLLTGEGVFESMAASAGQAASGVPFALSRHLARLERSAEIVGVPHPDAALVRHAVGQVLAAGRPRATRVRITWTAGAAPQGPPTLLVTASPLAAHPPTASVAVAPWRRNERSAVAGAKTVSYAENAVVRRWALAQGADEALFATTDGRLCEGSTSNIFLVVDGDLVTPTLSTGCLPGVTRSLVLEWCGAVERDLPSDVLHRAQEVFLTSATRMIQPVLRCLATPQADTGYPAPGERTGLAADTFRARAAEHPDP